MSEPPVLQRLRGIARASVAAMAAVVVASAFLRHFGATEALQAAWAMELSRARWLHRIAATGVLLGAIAMVALAWRARRAACAATPALGSAAALLGIALLLSAVGLGGGASRAAPVVAVNLVGGFAMLALCVALAGDPARARLGRPARWAAALLLLQAGLGALASAQASPACEAWIGCVAAAWVHRLFGIGFAFGLAVLGLWAATRRGRPAGVALSMLGVALLGLGAFAALLGAATPPALALLHSAVAAAALVGLAREA